MVVDKSNNAELKETLYVAKSVELRKTELLKPVKKHGVNVFLYFSSAAVSLQIFAISIAFYWASPILPKLNGRIEPENNPLGRSISSTEQSWIVGIMGLGASFGPLFVGKMADTIGRKNTLLLIALPASASFIMVAFATNVIFFYIARFLLGISAGSIFTVLPMYLAEISEVHNRGTISCLMGVFVNLSILFTYILGTYTSISVFSLCSLIPIIIYVICFVFFIPESPYYLVLRGDIENAKISMRRFRRNHSADSEKEIKEIVKGVKEAEGKGKIKDLFMEKNLRKCLMISAGLVILLQFSGISAVAAYMHLIFDASDGILPPHIASIFVGFIKCGSIIFTSTIVERLGRRILLICSTVGCGVSLVALGIFFQLKTHQIDLENVSWLPILSLTVYIICFNLGLGPLPWTIMGEIFPTNVKSTAACLVSSICFIANFLVTLCFPIISNIFGMSQAFYIFAICCAFGVLFIFSCVPETKGRSLYEIQQMIISNPNHL